MKVTAKIQKNHRGHKNFRELIHTAPLIVPPPEKPTLRGGELILDHDKIAGNAIQ